MSKVRLCLILMLDLPTFVDIGAIFKLFDLFDTMYLKWPIIRDGQTVCCRLKTSCFCNTTEGM